MALHLDHVVVLVDDLEQAARDYGELGFNVSPGGRHDNGVTHNAIIPFEDNSYIELLAFTKGLGAMGQLRPSRTTEPAGRAAHCGCRCGRRSRPMPAA